MDASCYGMENFCMQVGIALGNIASVLSVPSEETGIVSELKAGSEEAFAWLIAKYHQPIYSLIARTIPDPADAADLTQDVFIKIYRGIGGFNGDSSLRTWIYRIALREASNQRRWWGRHKRQEVTIETEFGESNDGQPLALKTPSSTLMNRPLTGPPRRGSRQSRRGAAPHSGAVPRGRCSARYRGFFLRRGGGDPGRESWHSQVASNAWPCSPESPVGWFC